MHLRVVRKTFTPLSTSGELSINGEFAAFTLEPVWREDGEKPRAIPPGTYSVVIRWSQKHKRNVPGLLNVPGFSDVEIHPGNFPKDTEACLLLGKTRSKDFVGESVVTFQEVFEQIQEAVNNKEVVDITYVNEAHPLSS